MRNGNIHNTLRKYGKWRDREHTDDTPKHISTQSMPLIPDEAT